MTVHLARILFFPLAFAAFCPGLFGQPLTPSKLPAISSLFSPALYAELAASGKVVRTAAAKEGPGILPRHEGARGIGILLAEEKPNLLVEALYMYRRPKPADPSAELRALYATFLSISSLEGIEYYSASRKKMRTFYAESYRIDSLESRLRLPDPLPPPGLLPPQAQYFAYQKDLTFGANIYQCVYRAFPDAVILESINLTGLSYYGIPVMGPKGLRIRLMVIQAEEAIVFYAVSSADVPSMAIIRDKVEESIGNRTAALYKWFEERQKK